MAERADRHAPRPTDEISRATDEDRDFTGSDADEFDDVDGAAAGDDEDEDTDDFSDR
jgi:hypothetical protein